MHWFRHENFPSGGEPAPPVPAQQLTPLSVLTSDFIEPRRAVVVVQANLKRGRSQLRPGLTQVKQLNLCAVTDLRPGHAGARFVRVRPLQGNGRRLQRRRALCTDKIAAWPRDDSDVVEVSSHCWARPPAGRGGKREGWKGQR